MRQVLAVGWAATRSCPNRRAQTTATGRARRSVRLAAPLLAGLLCTQPAAAEDGGLPPAGRLDYAISREEVPVGKQSVEFLHEANGLVVRTHVEIDVTFLSVTIYRFRHDAEERWADGRLAAFTSSTDDDGKPREVALIAENGRLKGRYNDNPLDLPGDLIPASLWHPATAEAKVLLDPIRGRERQVEVANRGLETVSARGEETEARHYAITGQITRDIWYDAAGKLVLVRFPAKDGSEITVTLQ